MKKASAVLLALALAGTAGAVHAADASAGKAKSNTCVACHGAKGISNNPMYPNLAGQKAQYLAKQMKEFREGKRQDPVMSAMAKPLSDADIANLAAYYAGLSAE